MDSAPQILPAQFKLRIGSSTPTSLKARKRVIGEPHLQQFERQLSM
jgi:hypothetical protein